MIKFGDKFKQKIYDSNMTPRSYWIELTKNDPFISSEKFFKIINGFQNPTNKDEFLKIIKLLNLTIDEELEFEKLAMMKIPVDESFTSDDLPFFINKKFKDEAEADDFLEKWKKFIIDSKKPSIN